MTLRSGQAHGSIRTWRRHFPLNSVDDVVELFRDILLTYGFHPAESSERLKTLRIPESPAANSMDSVDLPNSHKQEPDLAFVSILLGSIEHQLTEPEGHTSLRLKTRPSQSLSLSPRHAHTSSSHRVACSPLSIHVELPEEEVFTGSSGEQATPDLSSHSPDESETKSQCGSTSSLSRVVTRRRRGVDRVRRRHISSTSSDLNPPPNVNTSGAQRRFSDSTAPTGFPCISFEETEQRYQDFFNLITASPKLMPFMRLPSHSKGTETRPPASTIASSKNQWATRQLICTVCEVLWCRMTVNKSRERLAHSQSIHSLLSAGILDSFGLAFATVAACRLLGYFDVDLALSEDHGWVEFGPPDARQTADVASWVPGAHLVTARDSGTPDSAVEPGTEGEKQDDTKDKNNPPPIRVPPLAQSWLYVNGHPVVCRPSMRAVAAAVAALQPGSSLPAYQQAPSSAPSSDLGTPPSTPYTSCSSDLISPNGLARHLSSSTAMSMQLITLKHRLLWLFFDAGCLSRYPLGLTNLGDLEDAFPSLENLKLLSNVFHSNGPSFTLDTGQIPTETFSMALAVYQKAVEVDRCFYANQHVYPYTCLASCLYRHGDNRGALRYWSEAARVIGHYNHSSEDWEIYRELLEVATQLMPQMFRCAAEASRSCSEGAVETDPDGCLYQPGNILDDPQCLAHLLAFYDHLCLWEEGSPVPVLHVGWVDKLMVSLTRFSQRARRLLRLSVDLSRLDGSTPQCAPMISEPSVCADSSLPSKRTRRHSRSVPVDREETQHQMQPSPTIYTTTCGQDSKARAQSVLPILSKPKSEEADNVGSATVTPINDTNTAVSTKVASTQVTKQTARGKTSSRTPLGAISSVVCSCPADPVVLDPMKYTKKKNVKSRTKGKTKELPLSDIQVRVNSPNSKPQCEADHLNSPIVVVMDQNSDPQDMLLLQEHVGPSELPTPDLLNHDDLLSSLAEACDQRLLNPAFLWGLERNVPFLPANVAPEEAFTRLLSILEPDAGSLFPTPPNSGGLYEPAIEKLATDHSAPLDAAEEFANAEFVLSTECTEGQASEHSSDIPLFPDCLGSVDGTENIVTLDEISDEFLQSVNDLVQDVPTTTPPSVMCTPTHTFTESSSNQQHKMCSPQEADQISPTKPRTMEELMVDLVLSSIKMVSIIELLRAPRFNSSAIKLALTAQSQVCMRRTALCPSNNA